MMWIGRRRSMPGVFTLFGFFAVILLPLSASLAFAAQRANGVCAPESGATVEVVAVDEGFALRLKDGRQLWPAGIDPPATTRDDSQFGAHGRQALAARLVGRMLAAPSAAEAPDRWGRIVSPLFAVEPAGGAAADVAEMIVAAGSARVRPDVAARSCLAALLRAEAAARNARLGLWADPSYGVLSADAPDTFAGRFGMLQIVEGRVTSIGESGPRTYLNFGPRRGVDFAVVVTKENDKAFERAGLSLQGLLGRKVRVRGLLDEGAGPQIEIGGPDWLELIEGT